MFYMAISKKFVSSKLDSIDSFDAEGYSKTIVDCFSDHQIIDEFEEKESQGKATFHSIDQLLN